MMNIINAVMAKAVSPIIRKAIPVGVNLALTSLAAWLAHKGLMDEGDKTAFIEAIAPILVGAILNFYLAHQAEIVAFTMGALPKGATLADAHRTIAAGNAPPASLKETEVPMLETEWQAQK